MKIKCTILTYSLTVRSNILLYTVKNYVVLGRKVSILSIFKIICLFSFSEILPMLIPYIHFIALHLTGMLEKKSRNDKNEESLNESETSESSDSAEYYGDEKAAELLRDLKSQSTSNVSQYQSKNKTGKESRSNSSDATDLPSKSDSGVLSTSQGSDRSKNDTPPPAYDPFDSLVDIAKADLQKGEMEQLKDEDALLAEYNDERPWSDRTRAGRTKNTPKSSH